MAVEKRIVVGASGASGMPLLMKCLEILRDSEEYRSLLVMSRSAKLTPYRKLQRQESSNQPFLIKESTNLESTVVPRAAVLFLILIVKKKM